LKLYFLYKGKIFIHKYEKQNFIIANLKLNRNSQRNQTWF